MNRGGYSNLNDTDILPTANDEPFDPAHQPNEPAAIARASVPEAILLVATLWNVYGYAGLVNLSYGPCSRCGLVWDVNITDERLSAWVKHVIFECPEFIFHLQSVE